MTTRRHPRRLAAGLAAAALASSTMLAACAPKAPVTSTAPAPTVTRSHSESPTPTPTAQPTTASSAAPTTSAPPPSATVGTSTTPAPTTSSAARATQPPPANEFGPTTYDRVPEMPALFYVSLNDGGPTGCGDTIKPGVMSVISDTPVRHAFEKLLADHEPTFGNPGYELHNALADSRLTYKDGHVDKEQGRVDVWLTGKVTFGGTCDIPRVIGQLEMTAISAAQVPTVMIWIDDVPLRKVLDQRGS